MRAYVPDFEMKTPASLHEALQLMQEAPRTWSPFAGGTDLMVMFEAGVLKSAKFLNLLSLKDLQGITVSDAEVKLGSTVNYADIQTNTILQKEFPNLCRAGALTGSHAIQNRGTIGGNIANASPAGDSLPALMAYDAVIELVSVGGKRRLPYADFHTGYKKTLRRDDELISAVYLPRTFADHHHFYRKVGTRSAQAISKIVFAGVAIKSGAAVKEVRLSMGSVGPMTLRLAQTENFLKGKALTPVIIEAAKKELCREITPIDDIRSNAGFRFDVAGNVLAEYLTELMQR